MYFDPDVLKEVSRLSLSPIPPLTFAQWVDAGGGGEWKEGGEERP